MTPSAPPVPMASNTVLVCLILAGIVSLIALRTVAVVIVARLRPFGRVSAAGGAGSTVDGRGAPFRRSVENRFPRLYRTTSARLRVDVFTGLPLTLMVVAALALLATFIDLVEDVRHDEGVVRLDQGVDSFLGPYRAHWLLKSFLWITAIGAGPCLAAILGCATALLLSGSRGRFVIPLWLAFLGAQATTWSSKYIIDRPRPAFLPNITEWNPSFPSGHSTATTVLIGMLGYVVACSVRGWRARFDVAFSTAVLVGLVCTSRVFLGVHFLSDVLAGIVVGAFWLLVGATVANLRATKAGV